MGQTYHRYPPPDQIDLAGVICICLIILGFVFLAMLVFG